MLASSSGSVTRPASSPSPPSPPPPVTPQRAGLAALALGRGGGAPGAAMVAAYRARRDAVAARLQALPGVKLPLPDGAFYLLPDVAAYVGPGVAAAGFGPVPDVDALARYLLQARRPRRGELIGGPAPPWGCSQYFLTSSKFFFLNYPLYFLLRKARFLEGGGSWRREWHVSLGGRLVISILRFFLPRPCHFN